MLALLAAVAFVLSLAEQFSQATWGVFTPSVFGTLGLLLLAIHLSGRFGSRS